jgi:hypothetical protein
MVTPVYNPAPASPRDLGLLVSILATANGPTWTNVGHSLDVLRPKWSSLAIDMWIRPKHVSTSRMRRVIYGNFSSILARFDRVVFLNTASRQHLPVHVRSSFSYRLHWSTVFADRLADGIDPSKGPQREAIPELLAGLDADYYVPALLPIEQVAKGLRRAREEAKATSRQRDAVAARARRAWVDGILPPCSRAQAVASSSVALQRTANGAQDPSPDSPAPEDEQVCSVVSARASPLYVSPRNHALLPMELAFSGGELRDELRPRGLGSCCGRQNVHADHDTAAAFGANAAVLSRGPWCPPSTFFILHRDSLARHMASLRVWEQATERRFQLDGRPRPTAASEHAGGGGGTGRNKDAAPPPWRLLRWEYVGCSLLEAEEAVLLAYFNYSALADPNIPREVHRFSRTGHLLPGTSQRQQVQSRITP